MRVIGRRVINEHKLPEAPRGIRQGPWAIVVLHEYLFHPVPSVTSEEPQDLFPRAVRKHRTNDKPTVAFVVQRVETIIPE